MIQQFKPDYLAVLFDDFNSGSMALKEFLTEKSDWKIPGARAGVKYKIVRHIERRCGSLDGSEIKVEFLIFRKSALDGPPPMSETCKPVLLFF